LISGFQGTTGVAIDNRGFLWASEITGSSVVRVNLSAGPIQNGYPLGEIDPAFRLPLRELSDPYTYGGTSNLLYSHCGS